MEIFLAKSITKMHLIYFLWLTKIKAFANISNLLMAMNLHSIQTLSLNYNTLTNLMAKTNVKVWLFSHKDV
jgi:DNA polymerase III psi subunit